MYKRCLLNFGIYEPLYPHTSSVPLVRFWPASLRPQCRRHMLIAPKSGHDPDDQPTLRGDRDRAVFPAVPCSLADSPLECTQYVPVRIRRIAYVPQGVMAFHACRHRIQSSLPTNQMSIPASVRLLKCPFRGGFKDSGSSTDGAATRKVCAIHSLQRSVVNISGKSIPSPPPRAFCYLKIFCCYPPCSDRATPGRALPRLHVPTVI